MEHFMYTLIMAAREHAKKNASGPVERRAAADYYLKVMASEFRARLYYDLALAADMVRRRIQLAGSVQAVIDQLSPKKTDLPLDREIPQPPTSKTGVTPSYISVQESYLANEK